MKPIQRTYVITTVLVTHQTLALAAKNILETNVNMQSVIQYQVASLEFVVAMVLAVNLMFVHVILATLETIANTLSVSKRIQQIAQYVQVTDPVLHLQIASVQAATLATTASSQFAILSLPTIPEFVTTETVHALHLILVHVCQDILHLVIALVQFALDSIETIQQFVQPMDTALHQTIACVRQDMLVITAH